jgi:hypothetical protein
VFAEFYHEFKNYGCIWQLVAFWPIFVADRSSMGIGIVQSRHSFVLFVHLFKDEMLSRDFVGCLNFYIRLLRSVMRIEGLGWI